MAVISLSAPSSNSRAAKNCVCHIMLQQNHMKQDLLIMIQNSETVSDAAAIYAEKYQPHFTLRSNA
jgi:hypothetical protein